MELNESHNSVIPHKFYMRHYNIPIFIPELACPNQCVFCNQEKISGQLQIPKPQEISSQIDAYLQSFTAKERTVEIAFFGGNFTGIDVTLQREYLSVAHRYVVNGLVDGIRISTRPDYISAEIIEILNSYAITSVELGAQSMHPEVLQRSGRGHTVSQIENASALIKNAGIELGLQMMLGLPGDSKERAIATAKRIVELGAKTTRIYPALVLTGTRLGEMYLAKEYIPLSLADAVDWAKAVYLLFLQNNVTVLRTGLHPSKELEFGQSLLAGPYHVSFKELLLTSIWADVLAGITPQSSMLELEVAPNQLNYAIGFQKQNKNELLAKWPNVCIRPNSELKNFETNVCHC